MARSSLESDRLPREVDTVIVGNGPSALILSYILHGWIPYYVGGHSDSILDSKLSQRPCLLDLAPDLYAHFLSSLRYSTQALPVNTLLDTLLRPNADTEINPTSCIAWRYEPDKAISHVAIGQAGQAGGQWAENPVEASRDIGTLSYAEQLSLPGYSYEEHLARGRDAKAGQCDFVRPSRTEVAEYLKAYPQAVGISDSIYTGLKVEDVRRTDDNEFEIGSLGIRCKHLVLASGIFSVNIPPPPLLAPIAHLNNDEAPLLVIGSGFTAADIIISAPPTRKIIHIYQWAPETRPSPLRGCHHTAYPEYAAIYRQMKLSTLNNTSKNLSARSPLQRRKSNPFSSQRDWSSIYEGLPNAQILSASPSEDNPNTATLTISTSQNNTITHTVGHLDYVVGRRGTLDYLSPPLRTEVMSTSTSPSPSPIPTPQNPTLISGRTLRQKSESSLEVTPKVFIIGSLAGDSLIRHAVGGCVFAAGRILGNIPPSTSSTSPSLSSSSSSSSPSPHISPLSSSLSPNITTTTTNSDLFEPEHTNGHTTPSHPTDAQTNSEDEKMQVEQQQQYPSLSTNGHSDLHLDRRKLARAVEVANAENACWVDSGWWAGGLGYRGP